MKCIQCATDNNLRDRTANQGRCTKCNHPFAFEPTSMGTVKITDPFFAKAIADISANNTLFFTPKQLFYLLDKRQKKSSGSSEMLFYYLFYNIWASGLFGGFLVFLFPILGGYSFLISTIIFNIIYIFQRYKDSQSSKNNYQDRQNSATFLKIIGGFIIVGGIFVSISLNSFPLYLVILIVGMISIYLGTRPIKPEAEISKSFSFTQTQFQEWLDRWKEINGEISKILPKILPSPREEITPALVNPDVTAYSFDRLVVCDSAAIAQLLIANNFHFENNCAVLSITGYPQNIFSTVMDMLRRNPDLKVYALHDATPRGVGLLHHLRSSSNWFENSNVTIFNLGLLPRQIFASRDVFVQSSEESVQAAKQMPAAVRQELSSEELAWLESGKFVELESFTPKKLMQVITQGIAKSNDPASSDSLVPIDGSMGGVMIFATESFG